MSLRHSWPFYNIISKNVSIVHLLHFTLRAVWKCPLGKELNLLPGLYNRSPWWLSGLEHLRDMKCSVTIHRPVLGLNLGRVELCGTKSFCLSWTWIKNILKKIKNLKDITYDGHGKFMNKPSCRLCGVLLKKWLFCKEHFILTRVHVGYQHNAGLWNSTNTIFETTKFIFSCRTPIYKHSNSIQ